MSQSDQLRDEADKLNATAQQHLSGLDPNKPTDAHLLGLLAAVKATIFNQSADILEAIARMQMTGAEKALSRPHRLRMAALRGDMKTMQSIEQEIIDEHESSRNGAGSSSGDQATAGGSATDVVGSD